MKSRAISPSQNSPIMLALDVDSPDVAWNLADSVKDYVGGFKLGPRLLIRAPELITSLARLRPVFCDNKYYDIPSTMAAGIEACFERGAQWVTIHGGCGFSTLEQLKSLEAKLSSEKPFQILCVTVLTSYSQQNLPSHWSLEAGLPGIGELILRDVIRSGLRGVVCSAKELPRFKSLFPEGTFVVPGIRREDDAADDQSRTATPGEALRMGAEYLVIGRPIVAAHDPILAAQQIYDSIVSIRDSAGKSGQ